MNPFRLQRISNYGTSHPVVARTMSQGMDILGFFRADDAVLEKCKARLFEFHQQLLRCVEECDGISEEVEQGLKHRISTQAAGRVIDMPSVLHLRTRCESFLQSLKMAIRDVARLIEPFYGGKGARFDHRFHKLRAWSEREFGADDSLTKCVAYWEPFVEEIVTLRNAVDHPEDEPGRKLIVNDFTIEHSDRGPIVNPPTWGLMGGERYLVAESMEVMIENCLRMYEDMFSMLFHKLKGNFPLVLVEIPESDRDPACPVRLRVTLPAGFGEAERLEP